MELYVTVEELKLHLHIDYEGEEGYLVSLIDTAQVSVETAIQRPLTDRLMDDGNLNPMLKHAIKILAGGFYANREPVAYAQPKPIPYTIDYLIKPHIKYT